MKSPVLGRGKALCVGMLAVLLAGGCVTPPGKRLARQGDEIVAAGQFFHTGTPVVLWLDPGGYDAYRVERRFSALEEAEWERSRAQVKYLDTPNRYGLRRESLSPAELERVRGGGWDLPLLRRVVDQFVLHYDVCGTSRRCFDVLHDRRGLSVHFLLDLDGTIYQTLDLKERAWHATIANTRSVGVEIANIGAYPPGRAGALREWYQQDPAGKTIITVPERLQPDGIRTPGFVGRPARAEPVQGVIQGRTLEQYDFTPEQYAALIKLTAALCRVFPKLRCDYPRDGQGQLVGQKLTEEQFRSYSGLLGHFHLQTEKVDPGPAFQWDLVVERVRRLLRAPPAHGAELLVGKSP